MNNLGSRTRHFLFILSGFNDVAHFRVFAIAAFIFIIFLGKMGYAWHQETHLLLSTKLIDRLPSYFRDIAKRGEKNYRIGLEETDEIFSGEEEGEYQAGKFERRGVELIIPAVKQLDVLLRRKAPSAQIAYQMGKLDRLKAWLYRQRIGARIEKERSERRENASDVEALKKKEQPALFEF